MNLFSWIKNKTENPTPESIYRIKYFSNGLPVERFYSATESGVGGLILKLGVSGVVCEKIKIERGKVC